MELESDKENNFAIALQSIDRAAYSRLFDLNKAGRGDVVRQRVRTLIDRLSNGMPVSLWDSKSCEQILISSTKELSDWMAIHFPDCDIQDIVP